MLQGNMTSLYNGNGGVDHRVFVKNALAGWKNVKRDAQRPDPFGVTQFGISNSSRIWVRSCLETDLSQLPGEVGVRNFREPKPARCNG